MLTEFTIRTDGSLEGVRASESSLSPAGPYATQVADCIVSVVRTIRFDPGPEGGSVTYSYPFVFAPGR